MTSAINPDLINGAFPIAGQDNSSQGFRDNFTNTKENFLTAYNEITDLQSKVLLASPLTDGTFNNDMQGNLLANPKLQGVRELIYNIGSVSGTANVDFSTGLYQSMTLSGSTTINNLSFLFNVKLARIFEPLLILLPPCACLPVLAPATSISYVAVCGTVHN